MTTLACLVREFAELRSPAPGNDTARTTVRTAELPCLHAFAGGLELDRAAVDAGLTAHPAPQRPQRRRQQGD
ncbi:hypothetical protein P6B95_36075 [Streptomyces atratus]|uniref:hypothetical protein n=1 Tax=Streptomyces atratus TaxID=1893 RepID=UPI001670CD68|nr:hypothetical protein [Streptomyces atratus]WPW32269.1 hypothetical protein P6B95_36075 [Streptomyces atratus]GGT50538.1 hypothetical protein GCM10010207_58730 [Streptomyces atratus]